MTAKSIEKNFEILISEITNIIEVEGVTSGGIIAHVIDEVIKAHVDDNSFDENKAIILCYYSSVYDAMKELECDELEEFDTIEEFYANVARFVIDSKISKNPRMVPYCI